MTSKYIDVIDQAGRHHGKKNLRNVAASFTLVPKLLRERSGGSIADRVGTKDPLKHSLGRVWASLYFHKIWKEFLCCMTLFVFNEFTTLLLNSFDTIASRILSWSNPKQLCFFSFAFKKKPVSKSKTRKRIKINKQGFFTCLSAA